MVLPELLDAFKVKNIDEILERYKQKLLQNLDYLSAKPGASADSLNTGGMNKALQTVTGGGPPAVKAGGLGAVTEGGQ